MRTSGFRVLKKDGSKRLLHAPKRIASAALAVVLAASVAPVVSAAPALAADGGSAVRDLASYDAQLKQKALDSWLSDIASGALSEQDELTLLQRALTKAATQGTLSTWAGASDENAAFLEWFMGNADALRYYVTGGNPVNNNYSKSLDIFRTLHAAYNADLTGTDADVYLRMMVTPSLTHTANVKYWTGNSDASDPVKRYLIYKTFRENADEYLFHTNIFDELEIEEMRWVMDSNIDDNQIPWLSNYARTKNPNNQKNREDAYSYIAYTSNWTSNNGYNNASYYNAANYDGRVVSPANSNKVYENGYNGRYLIEYEDDNFPNSKGEEWNVDYGTSGRHKAWMVFDKGGVCGSLAKTYANLNATFGTPSSVIGQPGHAAALKYGLMQDVRTGKQEGSWSLQNDISGWQGSEKGERLLCGWGQKSKTTIDGKYNVSYVPYAQEALNDFDGYVKAYEMRLLADTFTDLVDREKIYDRAIDAQDINYDTWEKAIALHAEKGASPQEWIELATRLSEALTYFPLPMHDLMKSIVNGKLTGDAASAVGAVDSLRIGALTKATSATSNNVLQPTICKNMANKLLQRADATVATFSFSGANANKIVLGSQYEGSDVAWSYSLDGGSTFTDVFEHSVLLTDEQVFGITAENDIKVRFVGGASVFTIDITTSSAPSSLSAHDSANVIAGSNKGSYEYRMADGDAWKPLDETVRFEGAATVQVRTAATGTKLPSPAASFSFTSNPELEARYVPYAQMTATGASTEATAHSGHKENAVDGNKTTAWHTTWNANDHNKWITVDLGRERHLNRMDFTPRQVTSKNGLPLKMTLSVSSDGSNWREVKTWTFTEAEWGGGSAVRPTKALEFNTVQARYVKLQERTSRTGADYFAAAVLDFYEDETRPVIDYREETMTFDASFAGATVTWVDADGQDLGLEEVSLTADSLEAPLTAALDKALEQGAVLEAKVSRNGADDATFEVGARPAAPAASSTFSEADGAITTAFSLSAASEGASYEYRAEGGSWQDLPASSLAGVEAGAYEVRVKAANPNEGAGYAMFASPTTTLTALKVEKQDRTAPYGYTAEQATMTLSLENVADTPATISGITAGNPSNFSYVSCAVPEGASQPTNPANSNSLAWSGGLTLQKGQKVVATWAAKTGKGVGAGGSNGAFVLAPSVSFTAGGVSGSGTVSLYFRVAKADQAAPAAPAVASTTSTSVVLAKPAGAEGKTVQYRVNGGEWQDSPTFSGLIPGATYVFEARYAGNGNYNDSPASEQVTVKLEKLAFVVRQAPAASGPIVYGDELASARLEGGAVANDQGQPVDGVWVWEDAQAVPGVGEAAHRAVFQAEGLDAASYEAVSADVTVSVEPKALRATVDEKDSTASKPYDGTADFTQVRLVLEGVLPGEAVRATADGAAADAEAGAGKPFFAASAALLGADAGNYALDASDVSGSVSIVPAPAVSVDLGFAIDGSSQGEGPDGNVATAVYGESVTFSVSPALASAHARGAVANEAPVAMFYLGHPDNGGVLLGSQAEGVSEGSRVDFVLDTSKGSEAGKLLKVGANEVYVRVTGLPNFEDAVDHATLVLKEAPLTAAVMGDAAKAYDGTTGVPADATLSLLLAGVKGSDEVSATADWSFADANAATKTVRATNIRLAGADAEYYALGASVQAGIEGQVASGIFKAPQHLDAGAVSSAPETTAGGNDGSLRGLPAGSEYRLEGAAEWTPVPAGGVLEGLAPGRYEVRLAGDGNHEPSASSFYTVEAYREEPAGPSEGGPSVGGGSGEGAPGGGADGSQGDGWGSDSQTPPSSQGPADGGANGSSGPAADSAADGAAGSGEKPAGPLASTGDAPVAAAVFALAGVAALAVARSRRRLRVDVD